jgi:RNA polymerase sigma factor (TIGR02999 family)
MLNTATKEEVVLQSLNPGIGGSDAFLPQVYNELRRLAATSLARQSGRQTLQATALVHEAWLRLSNGNPRVWQNRAHFFRATAQAMRHILVERARKRMSLKHGECPEYVSIEDVDVADKMPEERVVMIDEALERLQRQDAELAQVVMLKFFAGLTNAEVGTMTGVTERTVQNKWTFAKAWLLKNIKEETSPPR